MCATPTNSRLTVKLRGRLSRPDKRRRRTLSFSAGGAQPPTPHDPLQRLLARKTVATLVRAGKCRNKRSISIIVPGGWCGPDFTPPVDECRLRRKGISQVAAFEPLYNPHVSGNHVLDGRPGRYQQKIGVRSKKKSCKVVQATCEAADAVEACHATVSQFYSARRQYAKCLCL